MPWHNAPPCPACEAPCATPFAKREAYDRRPPEADMNLMYCPACGHCWTEEDPVRIAQAWWAVGAHEARLLIEKHGTADAAQAADGRRL